MTAPMHVWKKPKLATGGSVRVALAPVGGTSEVAEKLEQAMVVARPQAMQQLAVLSRPVGASKRHSASRF